MYNNEHNLGLVANIYFKIVDKNTYHLKTIISEQTIYHWNLHTDGISFTSDVDPEIDWEGYIYSGQHSLWDCLSIGTYSIGSLIISDFSKYDLSKLEESQQIELFVNCVHSIIENEKMCNNLGRNDLPEYSMYKDNLIKVFNNAIVYINEETCKNILNALNTLNTVNGLKGLDTVKLLSNSHYRKKKIKSIIKG